MAIRALLRLAGAWRPIGQEYESQMLRPFARVGLAGIVSMLLAGCDVGVNESVEVEAGGEARGGAARINGDVVVEERAVIEDGDLKTVNGTIEIKHGARVNRCATVNG